MSKQKYVVKEIGTHSFEIEEAGRLGSIEKALILKEIRRMAEYKVRNGKIPWVYYSSTALSAKFPYINERKIRWILSELVKGNELISEVKNKFKYDKTKSYCPQNMAINLIGENLQSSGDIGHSIDTGDQPIDTGDQPIPPQSTPQSTPLPPIVPQKGDETQPASQASNSRQASSSASPAAPRAAGPVKSPQKREVYQEDFEAFFSSYPRKVNKKKAAAIWKRANLVEQLPQIVAFVEKAKKTRQWSESKFIPHPTTFLNNEQWNDDLTAYGGFVGDKKEDAAHVPATDAGIAWSMPL